MKHNNNNNNNTYGRNADFLHLIAGSAAYTCYCVSES